jgi:hypothetical protein
MRMRRWGGVSVIIGLLALGLVASTALGAPPAGESFGFTGSQQTYTVPAGVTMLGVEAVGGSGAPAISGTAMDLGAALPVAPGEVLYVEVGQSATGSAATFGGGGAGGAGDAAGGAGGGASDVRTCSVTATRCRDGGTSLASRLIVAGGGGGDGGEENSAHLFGITCGGGPYGGIAQSQGTVMVAGGTVLEGGPDNATAGAAGGGGASGGVGGFTPACSGGIGPHNFGGDVAGQTGMAGIGGTGGASSAGPIPGGGGGGGGGYFGGGGGSSGQVDLPSPACGAGGCSASDGSGGGGGSSFYVSAATGEIFDQNAGTQVPSVTMTPLVRVHAPAAGARFAKGQVVRASYSCLDTCTGTVPSGSKINTRSIGVHTFEVTDRYESHNPAVYKLRYTVVAKRDKR